MKLSENAKKAIKIGSLCSVSYLAVYIARNILSAVTPHMTEGGFSESYIGTVSSVYFVCYAVGQLINGAIGDKINARWMISLGLFLAGISNLLFTSIASVQNIAPYVYGCTGFFLAMIYGPMTKVVAENTEPIYATRCSLGYTFASFLGSPMAGFLAMFFTWQQVFFAGSSVLILMAVICFTVFLAFEKKGIVKYGMFKREKKEKVAGGIKLLFQRGIVKYTLISIITGVVRTSVVFWLPTFISQYHGFSAATASGIFTAATLMISFTTFIAIFIYEKLGRNMDKTILLMFLLSSAFFALTYFIELPALGILCIVLAIMSSNGAATMLWSRYCPSLYDTGLVSSATGFLDFVSYIAAAVANLAFANAVGVIGWGNLILVWFALMVLGVVVALPYGKWRAKNLAAPAEEK